MSDGIKETLFEVILGGVFMTLFLIGIYWIYTGYYYLEELIGENWSLGVVAIIIGVPAFFSVYKGRR